MPDAPTITLKFRIHNVSPVDDDTVRGVFMVPDYDDPATRQVLGLARGVKDSTKLVIGEINGDQHVSELIKDREVAVTLTLGPVPVPPPVKDTGAKKRAKKE